MASPAGPRVTGRVAHRLGRLLRTRNLGPRATAVALAVTTRIVVANAVAGLLVAVFLTISENVPEEPNAWLLTILWNGAFYLVSMVLLTILAVIRGKHTFAPSWRFLDSDEPVTDADLFALFRLPTKMAFFPVPYWVAAAIVGVVVRIVFGSTPGQVVAGGVTLLAGGLVAATASFLLGERALRPAFAIALDGRPPPPQPALGIGTRVVLAWVLGAGLPLALIGVLPFLVQDADLGLRWPILTLSIIGLVSGFAIVLNAARSISRPLAPVRTALIEVGEGNLDVEVVVDDGGEIGRLQAGVNEMVLGLRERERVVDLFGRHVGTAVARQAVADGARLGGEVRDISALFVDLRGSTALARRAFGHRGRRAAQPVLRHRRRDRGRGGGLARQVRGRRRHVRLRGARRPARPPRRAPSAPPGSSASASPRSAPRSPISTPGSAWPPGRRSSATSAPSTASSTPSSVIP